MHLPYKQYLYYNPCAVLQTCFPVIADILCFLLWNMELLLLKLKEKMIQEFLIKFCIAETPAGVYSPMNSNTHVMLFKVTKNWKIYKTQRSLRLNKSQITQNFKKPTSQLSKVSTFVFYNR